MTPETTLVTVSPQFRNQAIRSVMAIALHEFAGQFAVSCRKSHHLAFSKVGLTALVSKIYQTHFPFLMSNDAGGFAYL